MANDLDLSGFDEEIEKDELDLSGFDEEISFEPGEGEMSTEDIAPEVMSELRSFGVGASEGSTLGADRTLGGVASALTEDFDNRSGGVLSDIAGSPQDIKNQLEYLKLKKNRVLLKKSQI